MKRALFAAWLFSLAAAAAAQDPEFSSEEVRAILRHGPWPPTWRPDPSNRVSGDPQAIALGEKLFFEPRLSSKGAMLCATCHVPYLAFQDGRARAMGHVEVDRNTPSLLDVRWNRWFGWDGSGDSLWAQSIRPVLDAREMGGSLKDATALIREDPEYRCRYQETFGSPPPADDESLLADIGKALAAFQETLVSGRSPFDDFRDALERSDRLVLPVSAYAESLVGPSRRGTDAVATLDAFLDAMPATVEPATREIGRRAASLRAAHRPGLRLPDALVLATAAVVGADLVLTTDRGWPDTRVAVRILGASD